MMHRIFSATIVFSLFCSHLMAAAPGGFSSWLEALKGGLEQRISVSQQLQSEAIFDIRDLYALKATDSLPKLPSDLGLVLARFADRLAKVVGPDADQVGALSSSMIPASPKAWTEDEISRFKISFHRFKAIGEDLNALHADVIHQIEDIGFRQNSLWRHRARLEVEKIFSNAKAELARTMLRSISKAENSYQSVCLRVAGQTARP